MKSTYLIAAGAIASIAFTSCGRQDASSGGIKIDGSDTMLQVGLAWSEAYKSVKPDVPISVDGKGSGTGIKALINGTVVLAHSSRAIKDTESAQIKEKYGKDPVAHIVGYDGIAVYVHKDNPVKVISLPELKEIWGEGGSIESWSAVAGSDLEIKRAGRNQSSGTHGFFKKAVLGKGVEFKQGTGEMPGSTAVVEFCQTTPSAIGYSGMSYKTPEVGWVSISKEKGATAYEPSIENVAAGNYPVARPLYLYTIGEPEGPLKDYIDWVKSGGQEALAGEGFVPLAK